MVVSLDYPHDYLLTEIEYHSYYIALCALIRNDEIVLCQSKSVAMKPAKQFMLLHEWFE